MPRFRIPVSPETAALLFTGLTAAAMAIGVQLSPYGMRPIIDERFYVEWAREIAHGDLMGDGAFWLDPLPAYLLGLVFALTKGSMIVARFLFAAAGVGTVALIGALARTLWSRREGIVAMWTLALFGPHTFILGFLLKEALTVHVTAWALYLGVRLMEPDSRLRMWVGFASSLGALSMLRGQYLPLLPIAAVWAGVHAVRTKQPLRVGIIALGLLVPLGIASAHNLAAAGEWRPISPLGGPNFYIGNNPTSSGGFDRLGFVRARTKEERHDFRAEAERRLGHPVTLHESSTFWFAQGLAFWRDEPLAAIATTIHKAWLLVHDYEIPDAYSYTCFRRYFTPVLWMVPLGFGALLGLALLGALEAFRAQPRSRLALAFGVLYGGSVVIFIILDRYRIPLCLPLCLFASHALVLLKDRRLKWNVAVPVWLAATVLAFVPNNVSSRRDAHEAFCLGQAGLVLEADGLKEQAKPWLDEARKRSGDMAWLDAALEELHQRGTVAGDRNH